MANKQWKDAQHPGHQRSANQHPNEVSLLTHYNDCNIRNRKTHLNEDMEKLALSNIAGVNVKWCSYCAKLAVPQNLNITYHDPAIPLSTENMSTQKLYINSFLMAQK